MSTVSTIGAAQYPPSSRLESIGAVQEPQYPACSVIAIVVGAVLVGNQGLWFNGLDMAVMRRCLVLGTYVYKVLKDNPQSRICAVSRTVGYFMPTEVLPHISGSLDELCRRCTNPDHRLNASTHAESQAKWVIHTEITGIHCAGKMPPAMAEFLEATRVIDSTPPEGKDPTAGVPNHPLLNMPLEQALFHLDNLSAEEKRPLAATITFAAHTIAVVAYYVDEDRSYYYCVDSLRGHVYYDETMADVARFLIASWLPPFRLPADPLKLQKLLDIRTDDPPGQYTMVIFPKKGHAAL